MRTSHMLFSLGIGLALLGASSSDLFAQTCPVATGQSDREAGASNLITTCSVLEALSLIEIGRIVPLGRDYEAGMPILPLVETRTFVFEQEMPTQPFGQGTDPQPTGGPFGDNLLMFNDGYTEATIDQVGTQFDGPGHIGRGVDEADPTKGSYYQGFKVHQVNATPDEPEGGLRRLGVEHVKPIVTRGILVDVAPFGDSKCFNKRCWDAGQEITMDDVEDALGAQGQSLSNITKGSAVFFNTGWGQLWMVDNDRFNAGEPGIGLDVAEWLAGKNIVLVGADTWAVEVWPRDDALSFPVHQRLITDHGIFLHENMTFDGLIAKGVYEFVYIFVPVPIKGATGSAGNPVALF